jgi:hypothetical protein
VKVYPPPEGEKKPVALNSKNAYNRSCCSSGGVRYQLHLWIGEKDYNFLRNVAEAEEEPMARIIRRLIRQLRANAGK